MRLGLHVGYWGLGLTAEQQLELVREAEKAGWHSVWAAEAYGSDTATVLAWLAANTETIKIGSAIFQMPARSPAMTAMTAATLDQLSDGRDDPRHRLLRPPGGRGLARPALRQAAPAHARVRGDPAQGAGARAARVRRRVLPAAAARRPGQGAQADDRAGAGADADLHRRDRPEEHGADRRDRRRLAAHVLLARARRRASAAPRGGGGQGGPARARRLVRHRADRERRRSTTTSTARATSMRAVLALYVGGMGSREKNFYNQLVQRYGFEEAAKEVQDLYLDGKKDEAAAALPAELIDQTSLCGPKERIAERLDVYREAGVGHDHHHADVVRPRGAQADGPHARRAGLKRRDAERALPPRRLRRPGARLPGDRARARAGRPRPRGLPPDVEALAGGRRARGHALRAGARSTRCSRRRERPLKPYEAAVRAAEETRAADPGGRPRRRGGGHPHRGRRPGRGAARSARG